jgi:hypothetical protein
MARFDFVRFAHSARRERFKSTPVPRVHAGITPAVLHCCRVQRARWVMERLKQMVRRRGDPNRQRGALGYVLAWLLGVPIPILIIVALLRSCA